MGLFGSNQVVGVDLGYASIKVVGLALGKRPSVTGFGVVPVEPKSLQGEGLDNPTEAVNALKQALKGAEPRSIKGRQAYVSVSEAAVFRKILEVPRDINAAEMSAVVRAGIVEYLPEDLDTLELDYQPLPTPKNADHQQVMVVAVSKKAIEQYLQLCTLAGLQVMAIDPKPSALLRAIVDPKHVEPLIIVDVGSDVSSVTIAADRVIWVAGTVNAGGDIIKDPTTGVIDQEKRDDRLKRLAVSLADELDHVVKFYANRAVGNATTANEILLTGGGAMIQGFREALAKETGMTVNLAKAVVPTPEAMDLKFMGALGSALYPMYNLL